MPVPAHVPTTTHASPFMQHPAAGAAFAPGTPVLVKRSSGEKSEAVVESDGRVSLRIDVELDERNRSCVRKAGCPFGLGPGADLRTGNVAAFEN